MISCTPFMITCQLFFLQHFLLNCPFFFFHLLLAFFLLRSLILCVLRVFRACSAPLAGLGRLRPREHPSDYGTPREAHMWRPLTPQHPAGGEDRSCGEHYAKLADQCAARQVIVALVLV